MNTLNTGKLSPRTSPLAINWKMVLRFAIFGIGLPLLPILISGRFDWWQAWAYAIVTILISLLSRYILYLKDPALFAERARFTQAEGIKGWDSILVVLIALVGPIVALVVAGLDKRYVWSPDLPVWALILSTVLFAVAFVMSCWAMLANPFFSSVARIQKERGQVTITTGPYRFVRHPGYVGALAAWIATPFLLGTLWAMIPVGVIVVLYVVRTALEDRMLHAELQGYPEYAAWVRYRLLPGLW